MQPTVLPAAVPASSRRRVPAVVAGVLLAAAVWLAPQGTAHAAPCIPETAGSCPSVEAPGDPTPTEQVLAPEVTNTKPAPDRDVKPAPEPTRVHDRKQPAPAPAPAAPAPAVQAPQPAVVQAPATLEPEVAETPSETPTAAPTATATATASATRSASPSPSKSSNWDTPIDQGKETQAAVLATGNFSGPNMLGLFGILGGVLLVGLGGLAFALWSKNRLSSH
ncbi:hypothetical protein IG195_01625 [Arthrobacter sp. TES]|uniref:Uncharacterized protein n=1 Tax=Paenarthrobacter ureafaciens TaxID=37931 RepID=A0AAX3EMF1_PAEUR|nr:MULTISPECIES: hypothetical protein [Paenarthrobacter]AMB39853.1 hypothetical protein AUT26_06275 [Arthrobacter sp. ATCC 21022]ERI38538.1 hypothetical protein M707_05250 [Arthrobacter sp. AK-YN10]NKR11084.1 hypothetical protein [Arthrobacter sp. M5]NKR17541.1 hypothetical protein [Arthrobacter sp. M6]OEH64067.1 hypothetical protein A5N13_13890 [Arthrobacter sp. D4]OEH64621.1 hypothetical protein A5N17_05265 [Arthrobacter sp. D2]QOI63849.1 hypothetical protein IG195_01625 [Arthrobacter sp. 